MNHASEDRPTSFKGRLLQPDAAHPYPLAVQGDGIYIIDANGKRYLDGSSGAFLSAIGHAVPEVAEAIYEQAKKLEFAHRTQFLNEPLLEMTELLTAMTPGDLKAVYFTSSGSESNETAIKIARRHALATGQGQKQVMLSRWLSYHGNTLGAQSLSGITRLRDDDFPLLHPWPRVAPCYCFRCPFHQVYPGCGLLCALDLEHKILEIGPQYVAAFFIEPVVGSSCPGAVPPPEYYPLVREICDRHGVLLVADEVITGFGRIGRNFGIEHWNVVPDMITLGKMFSAGYSPLGATIISTGIHQTLLDRDGRFPSGHSLNFSPLALAAGLAVQKFMQRHDLTARSVELGQYMFAGLRTLADRHEILGDVRGLGLLAGLELVASRSDNRPFPADKPMAGMVAAAAMEQGLVVYPSRNGYQGLTLDFVSLAPPLTITRNQIDEMLEKLDMALVKVKV